MSGAPARAVFATVILVLALALASACGGNSEPAPTPGTIIEGNAVQIFLKEAYKVGWFTSEDDIEIQSEALLYEQALARATDMDLSLYAPVPGTPPYPNGLPGWLITARGDFFDLPSGVTPTPDTPRRPALAAAFVDSRGHLAYSMRFTDVAPATITPKETLPPTYP